MYCKKCNSEIPDGSKFCPKCGSPVENSVQTEDALKQESSKGKNGKKHILRNTLITIIACAAVVAVVLLIVLLPRDNSENLMENEENAVIQSEIEAEDIEENAEESEAGSNVSSDTGSAGGSSGSGRKTEIDLDDYVVVTFDGYDGIGEATAEIDYSAIENDYGSKIKVIRSKRKELPDAVDNVFRYVEEYTDVNISPDSELSNGDHVKLTWDVDEAFFDEFFDCTFLYSDTAVEVSGLEIGNTVDLFEGVDVLFSDVAPVGRAEISVNNDHDSRRYTLDKDSGLSNGDVVTVTYNIFEDDIDQFMEKFIEDFGGMPETMSKEYTVYGLDSYIIDMSQLSEDNLNELKEDSLKRVESAFTSAPSFSLASHSSIGNWAQEISSDCGDDYLLENIYFLSPKEPGKSEIVFIYSVSVTINFYYTWNRDPETTRVFYAVDYKDLIQEGNGTLVGFSNCDVALGEDGNIDYMYKKYVSETKGKYVATVYDADLNVVE